MSDWWLPAGVLLAALALNYFFCLRPMRRGTSCQGLARPATSEELDRALEFTRAELARLRADTHAPAPQAPPRTGDLVLEEGHR